MKNKYFVLTLIIIALNSCHPENKYSRNDEEFIKSSKIDSININNSRTEDLAVVGKVWGYLKYYHPNIAKGEYNWDFELFRIVPKILKSDNKDERNSILSKWVKSIGDYETCEVKTDDSSKIKIEPDIAWISNKTLLGRNLSKQLIHLSNAKRINNFYISFNPYVGNPDFKNEKSYSDIKNPDVGYRLLSLYRYWNIIQYYYPYKNLIDENWNDILLEFIPKFINASNEIEYRLAVLELIARVHDTHANIWGDNEILNKYRGVNYAPIEIGFVENKAVVTGFLKKNLVNRLGLQEGDIITKINSKPVEEIVLENLKYTPASNYPTQPRDIARNLLRTNDTIISIEFKRDDKNESKIIKTYSSKEFDLKSKYQVTDTCFKLIRNDIAYINNGSLKTKYLPEIWNKMQNTKGVIIDIRNYPSDFPIYDLSKYLVPESKPFVKFTKGSIVKPGLFTFTEAINVGEKNAKPYNGMIVILINEITQSSAEFHSMAYRLSSNATVIGSTTAGADGNVSFFNLPGGIKTAISGIGVYYPDGRETQRIGIVPDIEIKPTIKGIKDNRDELIEKAIEIIDKK